MVLDPGFRRLVNALFLSLVALAAACGAGESRSTAMEITEVRLRGETVVVSGTWAKGLSTPPACQLLESRDGEVIGRFGLEDAAFDANDFSQELLLDKVRARADDDYHVKCSVTLDSAKVASDTAPVKSKG